MVIRPGVPMRRRTSRACGAVCKRLLPCFCSLTAVFFFSFSLIVFFCAKLPAPRVRKDLRFAHHHSFLFCGLSPFLRLTSNLGADPCWRAFAQSFIHSRLLLRAVLFGSLRSSSDRKKQEVLFSPLVFLLYYGEINHSENNREIYSSEDYI